MKYLKRVREITQQSDFLKILVVHRIAFNLLKLQNEESTLSPFENNYGCDGCDGYDGYTK
jgi:hypothetical protein